MISPANDRIETLKRRIEHRGSYSQLMSDQRRDIYARVFAATIGKPQIIRMAKALAAFLREKDLLLFEEDTLAGYQQFYDYTFPLDLDCFAALEHQAAYVPYFDYTVPHEQAAPAELQDAETISRYHNAEQACLIGGVPGGHCIAGYQRVLELGFGGLCKTAENHRGGFAEASAIVCRAASDYALRYAAEAERLSKTAINDNRHRLEKIADACRWISTQPPRNFFEAVQLFWLIHEIITCEQVTGSMSLGRIDKYLHPYYQRDIQAGTVTEHYAQEIIEALWLKFAATKGGYQNVTLGGMDASGNYIANDLSYMCLRASAKLKMDQPLLSVRWAPNMPDNFWQEVIDLLSLGLGFPAMFNDAVAIDAKRRLGVSREDAVEYGIVGCVELSAPAMEFGHTEGARINWAIIIELMLNNGECSVSGKTVRLAQHRPLDSIADFQDFYNWYKQELAGVVNTAARVLNMRDVGFAQVRPYPFLSSTMAGCLEAGRDVTAGGVKYNFSTINGCGMADTIDSLMAIKHMVFDEKLLTLSQFAEILRHDFKDSEPLRMEILRTAPRFGNDLDEPDELMRDMTEFFCNQVESYRNPRGGKFQTGLYTVSWHAAAGGMTGALPSGRHKGGSLANGLSPCQGSEQAGPTAVINSLTRLDHRMFGNGMVLDIKFRPSFFAEGNNRAVFQNLIETYFELGGLELQVNVVSRETLLAAQVRPEEYQDLIVRVSGFSAYFVDLGQICQDEIIARTEFGTD